MNNPDASKVILSDIQDKISGIEKAIVHVVSNKESENGAVKVAAKDKNLAKELKLNTDELEARLFPHQKLLRDRTVVKDKDKDSVVEAQKVLSPVDDNLVAVEFFALIGKEKDKVSVGEDVKERGGENGGLE